MKITYYRDDTGDRRAEIDNLKKYGALSYFLESMQSVKGCEYFKAELNSAIEKMNTYNDSWEFGINEAECFVHKEVILLRVAYSTPFDDCKIDLKTFKKILADWTKFLQKGFSFTREYEL